MEELCHLLPFFFELIAGNHESLGDVGIEVAFIALAEHVLDAGHVAFLLGEQGECLN